MAQPFPQYPVMEIPSARREMLFPKVRWLHYEIDSDSFSKSDEYYCSFVVNLQKNENRANAILYEVVFTTPFSELLGMLRKFFYFCYSM